jgi:three-Cys-motif partner protein
VTSRTNCYIAREGKTEVVRPYSTPQEWPYKKQTRIKHEILYNYLTRWMSILGRPQRDRRRVMHYVDGFAGSGRYEKDHPGSPIIAMEVGQELRERYEDFYLKCHFIERDRRTHESLRWNVEIAKHDFPGVWARTMSRSRSRP